MNPEQVWLESLRRLAVGNYTAFPPHECVRTGNPQFKDRFEPTPTFGRPVWTGEPADTLLVNADFGMGDTIFFYRYVKHAAALVRRLILRCDEDFKTLFRPTIVVGKDEPLPEFDHVSHMMCLPRVLGDVVARGKPYLHANYESPADDCVKLVAGMKCPKIGVCWGGNPFNPRDGQRSVPDEVARRFEKRLDFAGVFSLDKVFPPPPGLWDLRPVMADWNGTAHLVSAIDLVVSVDTAVAHLAAALGRKVWLLLHEDPDWRWGEGSTYTHWYDGVRIFRKQGSWDELLDRVAVALGDWRRETVDSAGK